MYLAGEAGVIEINGTVVVELITFLVMLAILARYVYPEVVKLAEARQRAVDEQLKEAEKARTEAEAHLKEAQAKLEDARKILAQGDRGRARPRASVGASRGGEPGRGRD
ncbi:MAG: ATP synthase F0 subunit B [Chloroflexi bacterium]|nr:MAG: ATP synthase F0 subunit B [Chloroflexota bacterium]